MITQILQFLEEHYPDENLNNTFVPQLKSTAILMHSNNVDYFLVIDARFFFKGQQNCPYDYIKIYDGKNEFCPVIGTFCGMGKFPYSIIGTSQDLFVEFVSSPAGKYFISSL